MYKKEDLTCRRDSTVIQFKTALGSPLVYNGASLSAHHSHPRASNDSLSCITLVYKNEIGECWQGVDVLQDDVKILKISK